MAYASLIGAEVKRKEDPRLITGRGAYVGDMKLPGMQYVAFVRSPYPHALVNHIDASEAKAMPGVMDVITGHDIAKLCGPMPIGAGGEGSSELDGLAVRPHSHYPISYGTVRHVGEIVAAVLASSAALAADAASAVQVDYTPLPAAVDMEQAKAPDAPRLFKDMQSNVHHTWTKKVGDADAAFASAHKVVTRRLVNQRLAGVSMEGRAVVAYPDPLGDGLTVYTSTQAPHLTRGSLAEILRMDENQIRVVAPDVGGGFGVKIGVYPEDAALAALARHLRLPMSWVEGRIEHMTATTHGRGQVGEFSAAVKADGTITALRFHITADIGAYPIAAGLPNLTGMMAVGVYKIPVIDGTIDCVYTNTTPVAAYRGAGRPEAAYYIERMLDAVADDLGLDAAEVRRVNFIPPEQFPYKTPTGPLYDSGEYDRAMRKLIDISDYQALLAEQARRRADYAAGKPTALLGLGFACYVEMCGFGPYESATVRVEPTGTVTVFTGTSPHGQGLYTTFAQIVSDQLGADFDNVIVKSGDTANTPMGQGTMGSRSLAIGGGALVEAIKVVRAKAVKIAAHLLEANPDDVVYAEGKYHVKGAPDSGLSLVQIAKRAYTDKLPGDVTSGLEATEFFRPAELIYPFGAHLAVVEVDADTGDVRVAKYYTVDDCGPRISPTLVAGQVHGGLAQGIGQALYEEVVYSDNGQILSGSLMDYALPRADNFPDFVLDKTETPTPLNPLGVKGIGEAATVGSTPAVANAVIDALLHLGVTALDIPMRPERVWRAIHGA
jgi:aerobic carbon-monoxide dehydrogenase large subunit